MRGDRAGFSIIEAVFAIFLGALLVAAAWMGLARQRQALETMIQRSEGLATVRMARTSLARDVSSAGAEGLVGARDTVGLRVLRGIAIACVVSGPPAAPGEFRVKYRGIRSPDASKDSLRGLTADGDWVVLELLDVFPLHECDEGNRTRGLSLLAPRGSQVLVYAEIFEVGSYHLTGRALRYRGPGGTRQPLTPENVASVSRFRRAGTRLEMVLASDGLEPWVMSLRPLPPQ